jgi:hypothetical protein
LQAALSAIAAPASGPGPSKIVTKIERAISAPALIERDGIRRASEGHVAVGAPINSPDNRIHPRMVQSRLEQYAHQKRAEGPIATKQQAAGSTPYRIGYEPTKQKQEQSSGARGGKVAIEDKSMAQTLKDALAVSNGIGNPPSRLVTFVREPPARLRKLQLVQQRALLQVRANARARSVWLSPRAEPPPAEAAVVAFGGFRAPGQVADEQHER